MNMNILRTICIATELNIVFFTLIELYPEGTTQSWFSIL